MGLCDKIWVSLTKYESLWQKMGLFDKIWVSVTKNGSLWQKMSLFDKIWVSVTKSESLWQNMSLFDKKWVSVTKSVTESVSFWPIFSLRLSQYFGLCPLSFFAQWIQRIDSFICFHWNDAVSVHYGFHFEVIFDQSTFFAWIYWLVFRFSSFLLPRGVFRGLWDRET